LEKDGNQSLMGNQAIYALIQCIKGDRDGSKGIYHINITDTVTQFEFVASVEAISEKFMKSILKRINSSISIYSKKKFILNNGSEYING